MRTFPRCLTGLFIRYLRGYLTLYTSSAKFSPMELQKEKFISATKKLVATLTRVVEAGRKEFIQIGGVQFSFIIPDQTDAKGIRQIMEPTWTGYWKWLDESGVSTRKEIEQLWSSFGDDEEVLKCVNELHAAESKYNELTAQADADVQKEEDKVVSTDKTIVGSTFPGNAEVINVDTGEKIPISSLYADSSYTLFLLQRHYA